MFHKTLEQELFFDLELTSNEKKTYLSEKKFRIMGLAFLKHESKCFFNTGIACNITVKEFKKNILLVAGNCPKYFIFTAKLRLHANVCFINIRYFSPFLSQLKRNNKVLNTPPMTDLLCELPYFDCIGPLFDNRSIDIGEFSGHLKWSGLRRK